MRADYKSGFVTLIGRPNVGKSTLMNYLIGQKIAITSNKPQTTRNRIQTVLTREEGQIVFVDTPGIHKAKNKLGEYMVNVAERTLNEVDVVLWLVEPTTFIGAGEKHIAEQLGKVKTPVVLVINKVDMVKKEEILTFIDAYRKIYDFAEIVPVSARSGENTEELIKVIFKYLPYGPQFYDEDTITDQPERQIVAELIREKALHSLNEEIPHGIAVAIDRMKYRRKIVDIDATIICERDSHKGIIIGKQGAMLKKIGSTARYEIERMLDCQVNLQLWVKVKKDWRDSDFLIRNFGYHDEEEQGRYYLNQTVTVTGMILSATPIGEYDKRVVILTKEKGKISAFAKGARRQNSMLMGVTNPFSFGEFTLYEGRTSYNIVQANISNYFIELSTDLEGAYYGFYFLEFADYYAKEYNDETQMLKLLYQTFRALSSKKIPHELVRCIFELKALVINGEYPNVFACTYCGSKDPGVVFSSKNHGIICEQCISAAKDGIRIQAATLYALQFIVSSPIEKLYTFKVSEDVLGELKRVMKQYIEMYVEKRFKSLEILEMCVLQA